jgi:hypothetical protein
MGSAHPEIETARTQKSMTQAICSTRPGRNVGVAHRVELPRQSWEF